ncbi:MAG: HlyD family efflux transporter periplasmic adaptor subunit [Polyangia bacterium]
MSNDEQAAPTTRGVSVRTRILAVVVLATLGYGGYRVWQTRQPYEWSGTVEARTIEVGSRTGGRIKDIFKHEGDPVAAGEPILALEHGDLDAQRLMAQAALDQARANLAKLTAGARPEEIDAARARATTAEALFDQARVGTRSEQVNAAAARLRSAQVAVDKGQLDANRQHQLATSGAASRADVDNADIALRAAIANRDAANDQLSELKNGSRKEELEQAAGREREARANLKLTVAGTRVEDLEAARAQVDAAQGKLDQVKVMIDELVIKAPRAARVESLDLRPGDILAPNASAATLLEPDQLYVRIYVPETLLGHIKVGQTVPVSVDSFANKSYEGVVEHINGVGEYSPRNLQTADERADQVFATRVGLHDGQNELRAGMAAFIRVPK